MEAEAAVEAEAAEEAEVEAAEAAEGTVVGWALASYRGVERMLNGTSSQSHRTPHGTTWRG